VERGAEPFQFMANPFVVVGGIFIFHSLHSFARVGDDDANINLVGLISGKEMNEVTVNIFVTGELDFDGDARFDERKPRLHIFRFIPAFSRKLPAQMNFDWNTWFPQVGFLRIHYRG